MSLEHPIIKFQQWRDDAARKKYLKAALYDYDKPLHPPAPRPRRPLTPLSPIEGSKRSVRAIQPQTKSALFGKLPYETRIQIYREIFTGHCFHIVRKGNKLGHLLCQVNGRSSHLAALCWGYQTSTGSLNHRLYRCGESIELRNRRPCTTDGDLLPLLLSCRIAYFEAIDMLYAENIFAFRDPHATTFQLFASTVPDHRLALIQHLHLETMYTEPETWYTPQPRFRFPHRILRRRRYPRSPQGFESDLEWLGFWELIHAKMTDLKRIELRVVSFFYLANLDNFSRPLRAFTNLDSFDIVTSADFGIHVDQDGLLTFTLTNDKVAAHFESESGLYARPSHELKWIRKQENSRREQESLESLESTDEGAESDETPH